MKLFVTVGTTPFNSLVSAVDNCELEAFDTVLVQHAKGNASTKYESKIFINDIQTVYLEADIVLTHAGAGSIYRLLELGKKIVVVPNLERVDPHQTQIAKYVEENQYGLVCWRLDELASTLTKAVDFAPVDYEPTLFFKTPELIELIQKEYLD